MNSFVLCSNDELVIMYEKLMCSFGYMFKKFEPLTASYRLHNHIIPKNSKYRMFYVHYGASIIKCAIIITPSDAVYITYVDAHDKEKKLIRIHSYTTVDRVRKILHEKGTL